MHIARQTSTELELRHHRATFYAVFLGLAAMFQWVWAAVSIATSPVVAVIVVAVVAVLSGAATLAGAIFVYTWFYGRCVFDRARGVVTITERGISGTTRAEHALRNPEGVGVGVFDWQGPRNRGTLVYLKLTPEGGGGAPVSFPTNQDGGSKSSVERLAQRIQQFLG